MRTSGEGSEGLFIVTGVCVLTLAGIAVMGGPYKFFHAANRTLLSAAETVVLWVRSQW
jgi:hypothetical protein